MLVALTFPTTLMMLRRVNGPSTASTLYTLRPLRRARAVALFGDEPGRTGSGVLGTIRFKILKAPSTNEPLSCDLTPQDIVLVDSSSEDIALNLYTLTNGCFLFTHPNEPIATRTTETAIT